MKKTLLTTVLILLSALAFSQELIIVVAPFDVRAGTGFSKNDAENIEYLFLNELSKELSKSKTIKVLDQSETMFKETIKRMEFEISDWSNPKKVAEFGKAVNANAVLLGRIMTLDNEIIIAVRINDLTTEIKDDMVVTKPSEVRGKLPAFTAEIVSRLPKPPPPKKTYKIGDTGPGGGIVFYVSGNTYKECVKLSDKVAGENDIQYARSYRGGGYDNWYLSKHDELFIIYSNLKNKFPNSWYWYNDVLAFNLSNGEDKYCIKILKYNVITVRTFYVY